MSPKLPRSVVVTLLLTGMLLLGVSTWLELEHLDLLSSHPIYVNLLSGAVGFCFGVLALSAVLTRIVERTRQYEANKLLGAGLLHLAQQLRRIQVVVSRGPDHNFPGLPVANGSLLVAVEAFAVDSRATLSSHLYDAASAWVAAWEHANKHYGAVVAASDRIVRCRSSLNMSSRTPSGDAAVRLIEDLNALAVRFPD
ncbi:hypothetical protein Lfu02_78540 [Longispora fulva]|uniref:Uncharacterized protein n=1 Tax=Longispora fulva TaxID=619741 RepID=A0A8J7GLV1_9ACTN|nr:hypothetical protein [Longispora fulva]MBG6133948.1 hypothetical protein [Longispora fulva]GIG63482.1 hypothetical protein Lfu02_78540 [Longispora fulva]